MPPVRCFVCTNAAAHVPQTCKSSHPLAYFPHVVISTAKRLCCGVLITDLVTPFQPNIEQLRSTCSACRYHNISNRASFYSSTSANPDRCLFLRNMASKDSANPNSNSPSSKGASTAIASLGIGRHRQSPARTTAFIVAAQTPSQSAKQLNIDVTDAEVNELDDTDKALVPSHRSGSPPRRYESYTLRAK